MNTNVIRPTDPAFYAGRTVAELDTIIDRFTAQSAAIHLNGAPELAMEAMAIANAAWAAKVMRPPSTEAMASALAFAAANVLKD
jgi:hypothetical protein